MIATRVLIERAVRFTASPLTLRIKSKIATCRLSGSVVTKLFRTSFRDSVDPARPAGGIGCEAIVGTVENASALISLAAQLEAAGRSEDAIRLYEDGIRHAPCLEFYVNLSALWISAKRPDRAVAPLQKAIELAPGCVPAHVNLAGAFSMLGNYADALTSYRRAVEIEPDNAETLTRLSAFLERLGRQTRARQNAIASPR